MRALRGSILTSCMVTACLAAPSAHAQDLRARLDSAMQVAEQNGFSGVIRVEQGGTILLDKGYGMADRARRIPMTASSVVQIGSNTKDFTVVAILQLVDAGRVALSDPLVKYFPNAPLDKRAITIAQLMDHRAGFPPDIGGDFDAVGRSALVDSAMRTPLRFAPGTSQSYSNTGFSLLAAIIEQVSEKPFDVYVREVILAPLGLRRTGFLLPGFRNDELAHGYRADGTDHGTMLSKPHATDGPYWNLRGNGGMLSTVDDMHAFYTALFETDGLMKPATRALRFHPDEPVGLSGSDGVNFFLYERFPRMKMELIIASTNGAMKAPAIRRELGAMLGLANPDDGDGQEARRLGGVPAPRAMADVITGLVNAINRNDPVALRAFLVEHFATDAGAPTLDERVARIGAMRAGLGNLAVTRVELLPDGSVDAMLMSAQEGTVLMSATMDRAAPFLVHAIRMRVGG